MTASPELELAPEALRAEDLLLRQLLAGLGKLPALPPHQVKGADRLPRSLPISPEFAASYRRLARGVLIQGLSRAFGFRDFYLQLDDSTHCLRVSDPGFWAGLRPRLSRAAIDWLWWDYGAGSKPEAALTAWDSLLLSLLGHAAPGPAPAQLLAPADWPVLAWQLLSRRPDMDYLGPLWDRGRELAYPLRFLLIARSAAWFTAQTAYWQAQLARRSFGLEDYGHLQQLAQSARLTAIPAQLSAWRGSQMLGYDDELWIGRELGRSRLLPELQAFAALVASLGELSERQEQ